MEESLNGTISCRGFAYNLHNINIANLESPYLRLGTVSGHIGSHIKIECLLGNSNAQGNINTTGQPLNSSNVPTLLTIYGSFHDTAQPMPSDGYNEPCNFEGFYTIVGKPESNPINSIIVEYHNDHYTYSVYVLLNSTTIHLNYFIYLPNNCSWIHDGVSYNYPIYGNDPPHWYEYPRLPLV
jgi:hypothetical protein